MAGRVKHMERSHAGMDKHYESYRKSHFRSGGSKVSQRAIRQAVFERLLGLVSRHQDR